MPRGAAVTATAAVEVEAEVASASLRGRDGAASTMTMTMMMIATVKVGSALGKNEISPTPTILRAQWAVLCSTAALLTRGA